MRTTLFTALVAALALAVPAAASAHTMETYDAVVTGTATLEDATFDHLSTFDQRYDEHATWSYRSTFHNLVFVDGHAVSPYAIATKPTVTGSGGETGKFTCHSGTDACVNKSGTCSWTGPLGTGDRGTLALGSAANDATSVKIRPYVNYLIQQEHCTGTVYPATTYMVLENDLAHVEADFELPIDAIGNGKIIQLYGRKQTMEPYCPAMTWNDLTACSLTWSGKVTFTKVATTDTTDDPTQPAPSPTDPDDPAPTPTTTTPATTAPPAAPSAPSAPSVPSAPAQAPTSGPPEVIRPILEAVRAKLNVACKAACSGIVDVYLGSKPIARKAFTAPSGSTSVTLRFSKAARKRIRKARTLKLKVTTRPLGGGTPESTTVTVRVKRS